MSPSRGVVFDIQHYAVHDGPGIRTLVFLKGCPLACGWCCNPESQAPRPQLRHVAWRCRGCLRCAEACSKGAVRRHGRAVVFDRARCARCRGMPCLAACCFQALAVSGRTLDANAVMAQVLADREFYRHSGGGVTFSGGEPFAQGRFLTELLRRCRKLGIHSVVETCGHADTKALLAAAPLVGLFLFDLKLASATRHRALTGVGNSLILENLALLAARGAERIVLRVPLVPGFTADSDNLSAIAAIARRLGLNVVQLMPYHPFGRGKCPEHGMAAQPAIAPPSPALVNRALAIFARQGLRAELA